MANTIEDRIQSVPFTTQDYISVQHGDDRIDMYITEPAGGVKATTGLLLLVHGWGNDGCQAYAGESIEFSDRFNLVVTRIEYRQCGREAHHPASGATFDVPYDFSKLQTIDCLRAAYATLQRYPQIDRTRLLIWGGSQGGHIGAQCLVFAPHLWAAAVLTCGVYIPMTYAQSKAGGYSLDLVAQAANQVSFVETALGVGNVFEAHEEDIRSPHRNAELMPPTVPVILIHGTNDTTVDIRHSVAMYARLKGLGRPVEFYAIENGDHGLVWSTFKDEDTRLKATIKYAGHVLKTARRPDAILVPDGPVKIPVRGGLFEVTYGHACPMLHWRPDAVTS